ncbi:hypothetical protein [Bacillus altitudinis]|nr:hypothetical protein [Bacillus altitudinis]
MRNGAVLDGCDEDEGVKGRGEFLDLVKEEWRIEGRGIESVGEKGYEGFV